MHDREDVQSEAAGQGDRELVKLRGSRSQRKRDDGMGALLVVVRRGIVATPPHGETAVGLKLNLALHGAFCLFACVAVVCRGCAAEPQRRQKSSDKPAGLRARADWQARHEAWAARRRGQCWRYQHIEPRQTQQQNTQIDCCFFQQNALLFYIVWFLTESWEFFAKTCQPFLCNRKSVMSIFFLQSKE